MPDTKAILLIPGYGQAVESDTNAKLQWQNEQKLMPWQAQLCRQLGLLEETGESLPMAKLSGNTAAQSGTTVCAAPIHLKADRDTASLIPPQQLGLDGAETDELIASINDFLKRDGIELFRETATDWFMTGLDGQELLSFPPTFLAHRNASTFLPGGEGSGHWRRLLTEIQMLLHTHPINTARESRGKLPVNSLWFWGGAALPEKASVVHLPTTTQAIDLQTHVFARDSFSDRLCAHLDVPCSSLDDFDSMASQSTKKVVLIDTSVIDAWLNGDEAGALEAMATVERQWIQPLIEQVELNCIKGLSIYTEDGQHALCNAASLVTLAKEYAAAYPPWWVRVFARFR